MDKQQTWWARHRPTTRRLVQLYTALLYNAHLKGFAEGEIFRGRTKALCVPGLNCYSCPAAVGACPLGALQNAVAASAARPAFYVVGVLLLFGLTLGRVICGWACPFGLLQELLHKLPTPKLKKNRVTRSLTWVKYGLLALLVLAVPLYYAFRRVPLPAFCKYVCPAGTLEGAVALLLHPANEGLRAMLGLLFSWKAVVLALILTACVFLYRAFCRFLCPLGALYGLMTRLALLGVRVDKTACTDCGACRALCPMDVRTVGDRECIACGKCVKSCPEAAIRFQAGKVVLHSPVGAHSVRPPAAHARILRKYARLLALLVLAAALVCFNLPSVASTPAPAESQSTDLGSAVGQTLPDFTLQTTDGDSFTLSDHRGQVVILNLWATWCTPCVRELPYFETFAAAHADAAVLAIHDQLLTEDVPAWLAQADLDLPFAIDETGAVSALLGASSVLPHTVVLDRNGVVIYNAPGSVTAELLETLYSESKK